MQATIEARLGELRQEFTRGQARLQEVDAQQSALRETLLRISGAVQVLEEVLAGGTSPRREPAGHEPPLPG